MATPSLRANSSSRLSRLVEDDRGEVFVEYLIVLAVIGIVAAQTFANLGPGIVRYYVNSRGLLLSINP
jgi:hypothetical protein